MLRDRKYVAGRGRDVLREASGEIDAEQLQGATGINAARKAGWASMAGYDRIDCDALR